MYHILNNQITLHYGGFKELGKRLYLSAFSYILLLFIYTLETASFLKGEESLKELKKDDGFFAIFITFSVLIPVIMLILIFGVVVKKSAERWVNFAIWTFMALHLSLTLAAFIISKAKVEEDIRGFAYTKLIFLFLAMALALQTAKVHTKREYGLIEEKIK